MKLIDLLYYISTGLVEPIKYFRINMLGHNFIIKYLYFAFKIEKVDSSFNKSLFKKGENLSLNIILANLNKKIEILGNEESVDLLESKGE